MYEQYLRDPASVSDDWRQVFDNGKLAELPVIPTSREDVAGLGTRDSGRGGPTVAVPSPGCLAPSPGLKPIVCPPARPAQNMTDFLLAPTGAVVLAVAVH